MSAEEEHHDSTKARLKAHSQLATTVFELGEVPTVNTPKRYAVLVSSPGDWTQTRHTGVKDTLTTNHVVYCVGENNASARRVASWVREQMKDHRIALTGRQSFLPDPWISRPVQNDKDGPIVWPFATIAFDIKSEPA